MHDGDDTSGDSDPDDDDHDDELNISPAVIDDKLQDVSCEEEGVGVTVLYHIDRPLPHPGRSQGVPFPPPGQEEGVGKVIFFLLFF